MIPRLCPAAEGPEKVEEATGQMLTRSLLDRFPRTPQVYIPKRVLYSSLRGNVGGSRSGSNVMTKGGGMT